ncbi:MAG: hypothetical protein IJ324_11690 [Lachnospiraceae bacterium]|nr:hypothetical protein [Lachnospiraceae bacterium]
MSKGRIWRVFFYCLGLLILAFGISLNTKTNLGVSPLISVSYSVAHICNANFGNMTFLWYAVFVLVQIVCHICTKRYREIIIDILQIPLSVVFTRFLNVFAVIIPDMTGGMVFRLLALILAIVCTGVGIGLTINAHLILNPGDGIVQALADCSGKKVSTVKNLLDATCVMITIVISLLFTGGIVGIGIGTILAVIGVGRVVAVYNHFFKEGQLKLSGLERK